MILNGSSKLTKREVSALEDSYLSFEGALTGYLLQNADEILQTRGGGQGLKTYDRLYSDPHVQAVLNKLADSVVSRDWIVAPGGDKRIDSKAADIVRSQLANLNIQDLFPTEENHSSINGFDALTRAMIISGRLNGYVAAEVLWATRDGMTVANEIRARDPRMFGFMRGDYGYKLRFLTKDNPSVGVDVPLKTHLVFSYGALDGNPYGRAAGQSLFWPVFFKRSITKFDLKFLENFASPKVVGKYPRGSQGEQIATLNAAINAIANETGISVPETMMLEYLQASVSGSVDAYERSMRYWDEQISEAILTETGSTNQSGSGGSRARDEVGERAAVQTSKAIADALSSTFNRLARWITEYNTPSAMPPTVYRDFKDKEDTQKRSGVDKILFDLGYRLTPERVADTYGDGYEQQGGDDKEPALISSLGVGGVQALTGLLTQAATGQLPKENAIAVLVSVFGIDEVAAAKMVPDAPKEQPAQGNPLEQLFGGQNGGNGSGNGNDSGGADGGNNPTDTGAAFSEDTGDRTVSADAKDAAELIADKARPLMQDAIAPWLTIITNFVEQSTSLEEIRDGLIDLFPQMDDAAFAEAMGQAMLLGDLAGRDEVLQGDRDLAFAEAIEAAVLGTLDFAGKEKPKERKKPNCTPAKSHFCQTPNGRGSCVSLKKKCRYAPKGEVKQASDYVGSKVDSVRLTQKTVNDPTQLKVTQSDNFPVTSEQFQSATLEDFNPGAKGMNSLFKTTIDGKEYFVKSPVFGGNEAEYAAAELRNEVAAKRIADVVGYGDRFLEVGVMDKDGKSYVVMPMIQGEVAAKSKMTLSKYIGQSPAREKEIQETMVLDYVLASRDRHEGNIFYQDGKPKKMIMIDNGLAFGDGYHWPRTDAGSVYYDEFTNNDNALFVDYEKLKKRRTGAGLEKTPIPEDIKKNFRENRENILRIAKETGVPEVLISARLDNLEDSDFFGGLVSRETKKYARKEPLTFLGQEFDKTEDRQDAINKWVEENGAK
jgi:phage gp29-like protein